MTKGPTKPSVQNGDWPLVDKILRISESIPEEEFTMFPPDFTENLDHYLYGKPQEDECNGGKRNYGGAYS